MRTQTLTSRFRDEVALAGPVDPTGWLAPVPADGSKTDTPGLTAAGRRAGRRRVRRTGTERRLRDRRPTRGRRVSPTRSLTRLLPERSSTVAPAPGQLLPAEASDGGYRMSRWARLSLTVTVLVTAVLVVAALTAGSPSPRLIDVTVTPGDTLWSIAATSSPDRDPRAVIEEIKQLNEVPGDLLPVGVVLRVPASSE